MALQFHPNPGAIVICDYSSGFKAPEMVKRRLAVVISPRLRRRSDLCTVVPLSTTAPNPKEPWHLRLEFAKPFPSPWDGAAMWAKADMLATVGFPRLSLPYEGRDSFRNQRRYVQRHIGADELAELRKCVLCALGIKIES